MTQLPKSRRPTVEDASESDDSRPPLVSTSSSRPNSRPIESGPRYRKQCSPSTPERHFENDDTMSDDDHINEHARLLRRQERYARRQRRKSHSSDSESPDERLRRDPRFNPPTPAPWKRFALISFLAILFYLAFSMRWRAWQRKHATRFTAGGLLSGNGFNFNTAGHGRGKKGRRSRY